MKNPLKYRPLVNQVELSYWNPQPNLIAVRTATPPITTALDRMPLFSGQGRGGFYWKPLHHSVACGKLKKRLSCQLYAPVATAF
jgi:hypothetical protein